MIRAVAAGLRRFAPALACLALAGAALAQDATLRTPDSVIAGATFEVAWTGPDASRDQVTFAARGGDHIRSSAYAFLGSLNGAPAQLRAPADPGEYDVIYRTGAGQIIARAPITVTAIVAMLDAPAAVAAGGQVRVIWEGPRNSQDMISFAARGGDHIRSASYAYVSRGDDNAVAITAPETVGLYDIVYLSSQRVIGRAAVEVVEARIDLSAPAEVVALSRFEARWDGAGNQGDRIDMAGPDGIPATFKYIRPDEPTVEIVAPPAPGAYELVYVTREGRALARRPIAVAEAPEEPGVLIASLDRPVLGPNDAVGVIFDASGSMLQRIGGEQRVAIARETLAALVRETIPAGTGFALRVFGHRETGSCRTDLEIPLGPLDPAAAGATIGGIEAMNLARTPLGRSIELAGGDLANAGGQRLLILLTDGEETCDGDPAAAIAALRAGGADVRVNIVGFAIDDDALEQTFSAWADLGGGRYFSAADRAGLRMAMAEAMAAQFTVADASGASVAAGRVGDSIPLPAGDYVIHWGDGRTTPAAVPPGRTVTVALE